MLWWLLGTGIILLFFGIFMKIREYKDYEDYKDFQNLTTQKRYIRNSNDNININKVNKNSSLQKSDFTKNTNSSDYNIKKDKELEKVLIDAEKKQKRLEKVNNNLDNIIEEISNKEEMIKNSIKNIEISKNEKNEDDVEQSFQELLNKSSNNMNENNLPEKHKKILNLAQDGLSREEIADQLNIGIRETALILRMHRRGADNA